MKRSENKLLCKDIKLFQMLPFTLGLPIYTQDILCLFLQKLSSLRTITSFSFISSMIYNTMFVQRWGPINETLRNLLKYMKHNLVF